MHEVLHRTPYGMPYLQQSFIMVSVLLNLKIQSWYFSFKFPLFHQYKHGKRQKRRRVLISIQIRKGCNFTKNELVQMYVSYVLFEYQAYLFSRSALSGCIRFYSYVIEKHHTKIFKIEFITAKNL